MDATRICLTVATVATTVVVSPMALSVSYAANVEDMRGTEVSLPKGTSVQSRTVQRLIATGDRGIQNEFVIPNVKRDGSSVRQTAVGGLLVAKTKSIVALPIDLSVELGSWIQSPPWYVVTGQKRYPDRAWGQFARYCKLSRKDGRLAISHLSRPEEHLTALVLLEIPGRLPVGNNAFVPGNRVQVGSEALIDTLHATSPSPPLTNSADRILLLDTSAGRHAEGANISFQYAAGGSSKEGTLHLSHFGIGQEID